MRASLAPPPDDDVERRRIVAEAEARLFGSAQAPVHIGRFEVRRRLGAGGLGVVYAAWDPQLEREVALKLLRPDPSRKDSRGSERMLSEARVMARLAHPNVVPVYEVGLSEGRVFLAMELVEGRNLRAWIAQARPEWSTVLHVFLQAGAGLAAAHAAGVIHRDFKPENILMGADGRPRVTDFGMACAADRIADDLHAGGGTPAYMAPEQHVASTVSAAADQYTFSVALYEALYGRRPFEDDGLDSLAAAKLAGAIPAPPPVSPVPPRIWRALRRGLDSRPASRWPTLDALLEALQQKPHRRALRSLMIGVVTLVLVAALIGAVMQMWMFNDWMKTARKQKTGTGNVEKTKSTNSGARER